MRRAFVILFFILWAGCALYGVYAFQATDATGSGFTRGFNRLAAFLVWQAGALAAALAGWLAARGLAKGDPMRWAGLGPLLLSGGFFALLFGGYALAVLLARL